MEDGTEDRYLKVLINLNSRLLCEALQGVLGKYAEYYHTVTAHELEGKSGFKPDNVLVDATTLEQFHMTEGDSAKVLLIDTGLGEEQIIRLLCTNRLDGIISTDTTTELFHKALQSTHAGQVWIDNSKLKALLSNPPHSMPSTARESFSKREREIVLLIAQGCKNREIASKLSMSEQTVKTHLRHIFKKAAVTNRAQLVPLALKFKL